MSDATPPNAFYAQSGGVTAVINASACGVILAARRHPERIGQVYAGRNGILGALAQTDIKRILSFILVSHIGYMIFGLGLATEAGLAATVYYVAHHITVQTALFLVTGLIENRAGTANIDRLGSLAKVSPFVSVLFLVPALNLGGIPPFSGFAGKLMLVVAGVEAGQTAVVAVVLVASLLSLWGLVGARDQPAAKD